MHLSPSDLSSAGPHSAAAAHPPARPAARAASGVRDWTCPFCPLLCDDLTIECRDDGTLAAPAAQCPRLAASLALYGDRDHTASALVDGRPASLDDALEGAAAILRDAHRPLFGGLATDVDGARQLYALAAGCGATVDHLHGDALMQGVAAMQDRGAFFTTLSEVRSRADLLIVFGCTPSVRYPRLYARILGASAASPDSARSVLFVGCPHDPALDAEATRGVNTDTLLPGVDLHDMLALWSALTTGRSAAALDDGSASRAATLKALAALQERIVAARYTVIVYEPAALPGEHGALPIEALNRIVKTLNQTTRAACLPLGGDDGALTVNQAFTWLSGYPLRTHVRRPERAAGTAPLDHDPHRYRCADLIAEAGAIDALLWVSSFGPTHWPDALRADVPAIVLGHPGLMNAAQARGAPTVFIPVATPGIDSGGQLFRVDSSVVLPLTPARAAGAGAATTVAAAAAQLNTRLGRFASAFATVDGGGA